MIICLSVTESLSLAGLDKKSLPRSSSSSAKFLPDVVPLVPAWRYDASAAASCPTLSPKSAFFRVDSCSSIDDQDDFLTDSPDHSRLASPGMSTTPDLSLPPNISSADRPLPFGPSQSLGQSKTCPSFSLTSVDEEKAACYHFDLLYWKDKTQCRKLVWTTKRLFIWLSVHNSLGVEEHIFVLFSLSSEKVFSYRCGV